MSSGYPHQGQQKPPSYNSMFDDGEPLFTSPPEERYPSMKHTFGAPPMGEPAEPSAHPDNKTAAAQTAGPSTSFENPTASWSGLQRQSSGASAHYASVPHAYHQQTPPPQPGVPASVPAGVQPGSPYVQTHPVPAGMQPGSPYVQTHPVPASGTSPLNSIVGNFNKYMGKAEELAGNIWSHMKTSPSVLDAAQGRVSQGIKLVQEGGFEGVYKSTFGMAVGEQLRKTYACYLSTSTGPVAGTLYISNLKFSFCSDRPLSYETAPGLQGWSYYKMVVPLEKVKEVIPSFNEAKPQERYIQIVTEDGHDFWFMGFVNYEKGVANMELALRNIGVIDPNGGLKAPWAGLSVPGMKKMASHQQQQPVSSYNPPPPPVHNPVYGGTANYNPHQAPNPYTSNYK